MKNIERIIKIAAPLMAVIVPCILLAGYSYHLGYIMTFGLSSDLIPKTMTDVLVESWYVGVMAMAWLTSKWLYLLVYVVLTYLIVVITFFWARNQILKGNTWLFQEINKDFQGKVILGVTQWHWICLGEAFRDLFSAYTR